MDRGLASYEEADFTGALQAFDAAARDAELSVEELLQLFEMRALVYHGMGNDGAMRDDLHRLVAVHPEHALGPLAPPPVQAAFHELRQANAGAGLRIEERTEGGVPSVAARVLQVPGDLVDHVSLQCMLGPSRDAVSRTAKGTEVTVQLARAGDHEGCAAEARTWQGGVLFRASIDAPRTLPAPVSRGFQMPQYQAQPRADSASIKKERKKWPWYVAAAGLAVVGGVTAGVVLSNGSSTGQKALGGATVTW